MTCFAGFNEAAAESPRKYLKDYEESERIAALQ